MKLPAGFTPVTAAAFMAEYPNMVPEVGARFDTYGKSLNDDGIRTAILNMAGEGEFPVEDGHSTKVPLLLFAKNDTTSDPAAFRAEDKAFAYLKGHQQIADAVIAWFDTTGEFEANEGTIYNARTYGPSGQLIRPGDPVYKLEERTYTDWQALYPLATRTMAEEARVSKRVVEEIIQRWVDARLLRFIELPAHAENGKELHAGIYGLFPGDNPKPTSGSEKAVLKLFKQTWDVAHPKVVPEFSGRIAMSEGEETPGAVWMPDRIDMPPAGYKIISAEEWAADTQIDLSRMAAAARMSKRVVLERLIKLTSQGVFRIYRKEDRQPGEPDMVRFQAKDIESLEKQDRELIESLARAFPTDQLGRYKFGQRSAAQATYMSAIEAQYSALTGLSQIAAGAAMKGTMMFEGMSAAELWQVDVAILKRADTYCWFPEQTIAVEAASASLFTSVRLTRDLVDGYSGWWYFTKPLDVKTTDDHEEIVALLWSWTSSDEPSPFKKKRAGITFSAYVLDREEGSRPMPSTKFFWPEGATFDQMMKAMADNYDDRYHTGSVAGDYVERNKVQIGKERTMEAIERMARFFAAGALWVQQRILTITPGNVNRHERKRLAREGWQRPLSDVQVVQLRRKQAVAADPNAEAQPKNWKCRWIVEGFWRNQFYPSEGLHKPKWINAYVKGPEGLPLKVPQHRIYTVNR